MYYALNLAKLPYQIMLWILSSSYASVIALMKNLIYVLLSKPSLFYFSTLRHGWMLGYRKSEKRNVSWLTSLSLVLILQNLFLDIIWICEIAFPEKWPKVHSSKTGNRNLYFRINCWKLMLLFGVIIQLSSPFSWKTVNFDYVPD